MNFPYFAIVSLLFASPSRALGADGHPLLRGGGEGPERGRRAGAAPLKLYVGPSGNDADGNDGASRAAPFRTLARAARAARDSGASVRGGEIVLLPGRYNWEEDGGRVEGLVGPSAEDPFVIRAEGDVLLDGADGLPPLSEWVDEGGGKFCTAPAFHPPRGVQDLWLAEPGRSSVAGGQFQLAARARHPDVLGGHHDAPEAWPVPSAPDERERPLPGSGWDKSGRLSNNDGDSDDADTTLGLMDAEEVLLSPPPHCFKPNYSLPGSRCTNGCQQVSLL